MMFKYNVNLDLFDNIDVEASTWSSASVGRFTAVLMKTQARRWPGILTDKKRKGNELTRQEQLNKELEGYRYF